MSQNAVIFLRKTFKKHLKNGCFKKRNYNRNLKKREKITEKKGTFNCEKSFEKRTEIAIEILVKRGKNNRKKGTLILFFEFSEFLNFWISEISEIKNRQKYFRNFWKYFSKISISVSKNLKWSSKNIKILLNCKETCRFWKWLPRTRRQNFNALSPVPHSMLI